jgi:hypothetical protein
MIHAMSGHRHGPSMHEESGERSTLKEAFASDRYRGQSENKDHRTSIQAVNAHPYTNDVTMAIHGEFISNDGDDLTVVRPG